MNIDDTRDKIRELLDSLEDYQTKEELTESEIDYLSNVKDELLKVREEIKSEILNESEKDNSSLVIELLNRELNRVEIPLENISYIILNSTIIIEPIDDIVKKDAYDEIEEINENTGANESKKSIENNLKDEEISSIAINKAKKQIEERKQIKTPVDAVIISNISATELINKLSNSIE